MKPATAPVIVAEKFQLAGLDTLRSRHVSIPRKLFFPTGDEVEDHLRNIRVVADDDKNGRRETAQLRVSARLPKPVPLFVVKI